MYKKLAPKMEVVERDDPFSTDNESSLDGYYFLPAHNFEGVEPVSDPDSEILPIDDDGEDGAGKVDIQLAILKAEKESLQSELEESRAEVENLNILLTFAKDEEASLNDKLETAKQAKEETRAIYVRNMEGVKLDLEKCKKELDLARKKSADDRRKIAELEGVIAGKDDEVFNLNAKLDAIVGEKSVLEERLSLVIGFASGTLALIPDPAEAPQPTTQGSSQSTPATADGATRDLRKTNLSKTRSSDRRQRTAASTTCKRCLTTFPTRELLRHHVRLQEHCSPQTTLEQMETNEETAYSGDTTEEANDPDVGDLIQSQQQGTASSSSSGVTRKNRILEQESANLETKPNLKKRTNSGNAAQVKPNSKKADAELSNSDFIDGTGQEHGFSHSKMKMHRQRFEAVPRPSLRHFCNCGKDYHRKSDLNLHIRVLRRGKIFECRLCPQRYLYHRALKYHVINSHKVEYNNGNFACSDCSDLFKTKKELFFHRATVHLPVGMAM